MKKVEMTVATLLLLTLAAPAPGNGPPLPDPALIRGNNAFAVDLYKALKDGDGNLFFSPLSVSTALAMTYAGARNETAAQMRKALEFQLADAELHPAFGTAVKYLNGISKGGVVKLDVANSLWPDKQYTFLESYLTLLDGAYDARATPVDYRQDEAGARKQINRWVEDKTNDKIKNLLATPLPPLTRLVLVNAVYFKGDWAVQFKKNATKPAPFFTEPEKPVVVEMMAQKENFKYGEDDLCQRLALPYVGNGQSMLILLPKDAGPEGLEKLEASLDAGKIAEWCKGMQPREVQVFLPKFKLTWGTESLKKPLMRLGMKDAFDIRAADFSGMDGTRSVYISDVVHKAFVEVNEEGTEAAAATAVMVRTMSLPMPPPIFRADHPFLFLIMDDASGQILFMGRVANPSED